MSKQQELKKILKTLLPKAVTGALTFQNHPFSPRRDHQVVHKYHKHGGPKGSIMMIPDEARRRRSKYGSSGNGSTRSLEPTSPTVSCMGQIKNKKRQHRQRVKKAKSKRITLPSSVQKSRPLIRSVSKAKNKKQTSTFRRIFWRDQRKSSRAAEVDGGSAAVAAPELSQMKRFASARGALANFDWKAHVVAPEDDEDDETLISFSEPIVALQPKTN
ncbi:uncharacterized protein At1g76070-like [Neltuma alba]|uniref:uncharacterized protein At1g76070-like n=1 Tax=Neltuma alba TaxID=207710 RepID=UPI0010A2E6E9|nr:uncharacterized protein At1g76070-like [Prosopis alba]